LIADHGRVENSMTVLTRADLAGADAAELRPMIGDKAADLVAFDRLVSELGAPTTGFRIVPVSFLDEFYRANARLTEAWADRPPRYSDLPAADTTPDAVAALAEPFSRYADVVLTDEPTAVRSSMVWPSADTPRFPGIDRSMFLRDPADRAHGLGPMCPALYKAYTSFCFEQARLPVTGLRRAGLILMDVVATVLQGTAFLFGDRMVIEVAPLAGPTTQAGSPAELADAGALDRPTAAVLDGLLRQLWPDPGHAWLNEVEFVLSEAGAIHLLQQRLVAGRSGGETPVFAGVGKFEGDVVDLRGMPRTGCDAGRLSGLLGSADGRAVVVPLKDDDLVDAFTVSWLLTHDPGLPRPSAMVATHDTGTQAGPKTHLKWTLREALRGTLFAAVPDHRVPDEVGTIGVVSDGVVIDILLG
jgi:hypothetical protein